MAVLQATGRRSESEVGGDELAQFIGACLSSYPFDTLRACLKLAHTIANKVGSEEIHSPDVAEVLQYRPKLTIG
jgi:hypothetical protein